jgi:hypothetical protein
MRSIGKAGAWVALRRRGKGRRLLYLVAEIKRTFDGVVGNEAVGGCVSVLSRRVPVHREPRSAIFVRSLFLEALYL